MRTGEHRSGAHGAKRAMAELYSRAAPEYVVRGAPRFIYAGRRLVETAGVQVGDAVLDLGTGRGAVLLPAAEAVGASGRAVGIDLAAGMIEHLRAEIAERQFTWASVEPRDAEDLDFSDSEFTHVLGSLVVFFFADLPSALAEVRRVLRPGGTVGSPSNAAPIHVGRGMRTYSASEGSLNVRRGFPVTGKFERKVRWWRPSRKLDSRTQENWRRTWN